MSIVFAILIFSFLIFIHELGHFMAAKASGIQVNEFSIFMGPAIFKKQVGETLYSIRCIPIGGFCAMEGEDEDTDNPRSFQKAAWWKRIIVLVAGAGMNFITGLLILVLVYSFNVGFTVPTVESIEDGCLIAGENGIQVGDTFVEIDGENIYIASDFSMILSLNGGEVHDIVVERNGERVELNNFKMEMSDFPDGNGGTTRRFGFSFGFQEKTVGRLLTQSWYTAIDMVRTVRLSLGMLLSGKAGLSDVSGPVGIVEQMSATAEASSSTLEAVLNMLYFGGFIAINLAVMNLLPIPALDGGRVVCLLLTTAVEGFTKKKINPKYEAYLHGAGMILLLALMAVIMFKDVFTIFTR